MNAEDCGIKGFEDTGEAEVQLLPDGVDADGIPSEGVDTVRGEAYSAEADTGGGRDTVRRAVGRMGESGVFRDRLCDVG